MNVTPLPLFWLELSILVGLAGAVCVSRLRDPLRAFRWGLTFTGVACACTLLACAGFYLCRLHDVDDLWCLQTQFFGRPFLALDELNAPLVAVVGLLHFLTALATGRTKMRRFSL